MMAMRPAGRSRSGATDRRRSRLPSSRLTSIRRAWNVRAAGWSLAPAAVDVGGVEVEPDERAAGRDGGEHGAGVTAEAERAVDDGVAGAEAQRRECFVEQDRDVARRFGHRDRR